MLEGVTSDCRIDRQISETIRYREIFVSYLMKNLSPSLNDEALKPSPGIIVKNTSLIGPNICK